MTQTASDAGSASCGGAGFIGSHFVDSAARPTRRREQVTVYDNFSSGRDWHLERGRRRPAADRRPGRRRRPGHSDRDRRAVTTRSIHLASNPDIAAAVTNPAIDFDQGTLLTHHVVEAARMAERRARPLRLRQRGLRRPRRASRRPRTTDRWSRRRPTAPASSPARRILAAYAAMFDFTARAFRFGNVVGPRQTHGVGFDFVRRLLDDPTRLRILGDGRQSKSYIHVEDVIDAVLLAGSQRATRRSTCSTSPPATTSPSPRSPRLAMQVLGLEPGCDHLRVHRRRPGLEGRRAGRPDQHRQDPRPRLGRTSAPGRRRCATR